MTIDSAISRLQALAKACAGVKSAPDYPIENANECPFSIAHFAAGEATAASGTSVRFNPTVNVDFLINRSSLKNAYKQIDALALEYAQRLCGDPRLGGAVETIVFPVTFEVSATQWDNVPLQLLRFTVQLKTLEAPASTA